MLGWLVFASMLASSGAADLIPMPTPASPLEFEMGCQNGTHITIAAVGDIMAHRPLQIRAAYDGDYRRLWSRLEPFLSAADITYGNLEAPVAPGVGKSGIELADPGFRFDDEVYTSFPLFNAPEALLAALASSGFSVLSTANNHALDRGSLGVDRTIEALERHGLVFTGTRKAGESEAERPWYIVTEAKGVSVLWLACTYGVNQRHADRGQVLRCFDDEHRQTILELIGEQRDRVDAIVVTPHWGSEDDEMPDPQQRAFAAEVLEAGATMVLGAHPHVLQPLQKHVTRDGRETLIAWSLGNFVSNMQSIAH